jgi:hypothetical protein
MDQVASTGAMPQMSMLTPRADLDQYGRPRNGPAVMAACAFSLMSLLLFAGLTAGHFRPMVVVGLTVVGTSWLCAVFWAVWFLPKARARSDGIWKELALSRRRRIATVVLLQSVWIGTLDMRGWGLAGIGVVFAGATVFLWWVVSRRVRFSPEFIENVRGPGGRLKMSWAEVRRANIARTGAWLWDNQGKVLRLYSRWFDGYPEVARCMLSQLPIAVLDSQKDAREILEQQAALLEEGG